MITTMMTGVLSAVRGIMSVGNEPCCTLFILGGREGNAKFREQKIGDGHCTDVIVIVSMMVCFTNHHLAVLVMNDTTHTALA